MNGRRSLARRLFMAWRFFVWANDIDLGAYFYNGVVYVGRADDSGAAANVYCEAGPEGNARAIFYGRKFALDDREGDRSAFDYSNDMVRI